VPQYVLAGGQIWGYGEFRLYRQSTAYLLENLTLIDDPLTRGRGVVGSVVALSLPRAAPGTRPGPGGVAAFPTGGRASNLCALLSRLTRWCANAGCGNFLSRPTAVTKCGSPKACAGCTIRCVAHPPRRWWHRRLRWCLPSTAAATCSSIPPGWGQYWAATRRQRLPRWCSSSWPNCRQAIRLACGPWSCNVRTSWREPRVSSLPSLVLVLVVRLLPLLETLQAAKMRDIVGRFCNLGLGDRDFLQADIAGDQLGFAWFFNITHKSII